MALQNMMNEHDQEKNSSNEYFGIGLEAGYSSIDNPETNEKVYFLCVWAAVIHERTSHISFGCSAKAPFSSSLLQKMRESSSQQREMKEVLSTVSGIENISTKQGGIHLLTDGAISRQQLNEQALHCALSFFVSPSCVH